MTGLRRTALTRRTELKRGGPLRRKKVMQRVARARRTVERQRRRGPARNTGPDRVTRELVWQRAEGRCERCGLSGWWVDGALFSIHHRRPRGAGGSSVSWINDPSNLLLLCGTGTTGCHGWVEAHPTESYREGWKVHHTSLSLPAAIPVSTPGGRIYLTSEGTYETGLTP